MLLARGGVGGRDGAGREACPLGREDAEGRHDVRGHGGLVGGGPRIERGPGLFDGRPEGVGLPTGSASAGDGEELFMERCAACHGEFGEGVVDLDQSPLAVNAIDPVPDRLEQCPIGSLVTGSASPIASPVAYRGHRRRTPPHARPAQPTARASGASPRRSRPRSRARAPAFA